MSNILKVTTPISGYDSNLSRQGVGQQQSDLSVKNQVDTQRITRADGRSDTGSQQEVKRDVTYDSNFGNFVDSLNNIPKLREIMTKLIYSGMGTVAESGVSAGTAEEIQKLLEMMKMTPDELQSFLKSQMSGANRLQGSLFDMLRQVMGNTTTVELKAGILDFLRKYNDMSSGNHILQNIKGNLDDIQKFMFRNEREQLQKLSLQLLPHNMDNSEENARILKEDIIPFLGKYVAETRDLGSVRDLISLLTVNTARYENGGLNNTIQALLRLMDFPVFQEKFSGLTADALNQMFRNVDFEMAAGRGEYADTLLNVMQAAVRGEAGSENKEAFMNVMNSILVNESVYMPVTHLMLPMILDGVPMFSEMWVDPDEESGDPESKERGERGVKLLIKFDMKDVGFFDIMLYYEKGKTDMMIHYPPELGDKRDEIRSGIRDILTNNGLEVEYLAVEEGSKSIPVSAAFPKIFERRNSINVSV